MRTLADVLAMEEPEGRYALTEFTRSEKLPIDGRPYASIGFDGMGLGVPVDGVPATWTPRIGSEVIVWGDGVGRPVRGIAIDGMLLYYHTPEEQQQEQANWVADEEARQRDAFERYGQAKLDADYASLPPVFQARIDKFRRNNPDFRWKYEWYEMFCCVEAVKLARHLGTIEAAAHYASLATCSITDEEERWYREWNEQKAIDKAAGLADGHSGNTHGVAVKLAFWFLQYAENVEGMHGALSPLVGSAEYGDTPQRKAV